MMIPIVVISFNRLHALQRALESYRRLDRARIVIHDTGSTFPPLLDYLAGLQRTGAADVLLHQTAILSERHLNSVAGTVARAVRELRAEYYVVTDPDIEIDGACPSDLLDLYAFLLSSVRDADVVGPMLRIDDLPHCYPLRQTVLTRQHDLFWHKAPTPVPWRSGQIAFQRAVIDTTFGMYRASYSFSRMTNGLRTYAPYWARHLDWYLDPDNLTDDQAWYLRTSSRASHWGGAWLRRTLNNPGVPFVDPLRAPPTPIQEE